MRRLFDIVCAAIGLVVLFPLFCVIGLAIILDDGEPIFYSHRRVGKHFQCFGLLKFRSMAPNAAGAGGALTVANDPRVTRVGRILRKYKLDELPQLLNVVNGDLALVGARPEVPHYVDMFQTQYSEILRDRPGITDPASLAFRHEEEMLNAADSEEQYISDILPRKLELSLDYARRRNFSSDLRILVRTFIGICWTPRNVTSSVRRRVAPHSG
ncbi:MAG TPA: sugar transferase [Terriglobia bacterium]|nr:sugar transferase [Terriglobia bacterium]